MNQLVFQTTVTGPELQPLLDSIQRSNWADSGDWVLLQGLCRKEFKPKFLAAQLEPGPVGELDIPANYTAQIHPYREVTLTILTSFKRVLKQPG